MAKHGQKEAERSFVEVMKELDLLIQKPGIPRHVIDSTSKLLNRLDKCLFVKPQVGSATVTSEAMILLQPSNLFLNFVAAIRAQDWPKIRVIEHEATS